MRMLRADGYENNALRPWSKIGYEAEEGHKVDNRHAWQTAQRHIRTINRKLKNNEIVDTTKTLQT
jgi:hypothetical protein